jgi:hypothetical protein
MAHLRVANKYKILNLIGRGHIDDIYIFVRNDSPMITIILPARRCPWEEEKPKHEHRSMGRRMNRDGYKEKLFIIDSFL